MSMSARLTVAAIEACAPSDGDRWLSDNSGGRGCGRLLLRIGPSGTRRWYFKYSQAGRVKRASLGPYSRMPRLDALTLEQARKIAQARSAVLQQLPSGAWPVSASAPANMGAEPATYGTAQPAAASPPPSMLGAPAAGGTLSDLSVLALVNAYVVHLRKAKKEKTASQTKGLIKNHFDGTKFAGRPATAVTSDEIADFLRGVLATSTSGVANNVRSVLSAAFGVAAIAKNDPNTPPALAKFGLTTNPVKMVVKAKENPVLSKHPLNFVELGHTWRALRDSTNKERMDARIIRLSWLLGGQRAQQLVRVELRHVDLVGRTIMLLDPKGKRVIPREHWLPLSDAALAEVRALHAESSALGGKYLFHSPARIGYVDANSLSKGMARISQQLVAEGKLAWPVQYLDIRRTCETLMSEELGINKEVRAQIQSHDMGGVQNQRYNFAKFIKAKLQALELWSAYLDRAAAAQES